MPEVATVSNPVANVPAPVAPVSKGPPIGVDPAGPPKTKASSVSATPNAVAKASSVSTATKAPVAPKVQKRAIVSANGKGPKEPANAGKRATPKSDKDKATEVKELIVELRDCKDSEDKKRIRRLLRARGHYGGLGQRVMKATTAKPATTTKAAASK